MKRERERNKPVTESRGEGRFWIREFGTRSSSRGQSKDNCQQRACEVEDLPTFNGFPPSTCSQTSTNGHLQLYEQPTPFYVLADNRYIHSYFNLSSAATSRQWQWPLTCDPAAKITSWQWLVNQGLTSSIQNPFSLEKVTKHELVPCTIGLCFC